MKITMKTVIVMVVFVAVGIVSGCGGGSVTGPGTSSSTASSPSSSPSAGAASDGAILYQSYCAGCHGSLASSSKTGITLVRLQNAIASNAGGSMGSISLTGTQQQAIVDALTPASTTPPPVVTDGAILYTTYCANCHGALATSAKTGITLVRLQNAIAGNAGGSMGSIALTGTQQQAIVDVLTPASTTPPPVVTDGATLYSTYCTVCHGALASSTKGGATATSIQSAINNNAGGVMGSLSTLIPTQISAIATALAGVTAQPAACGSCHAIPPATGRHSTHKNQNIACATCHGSGYSTTTVNAATHNNGVKNLTTTIGWNATSRSCSNSCHGTHSW